MVVVGQMVLVTGLDDIGLVLGLLRCADSKNSPFTILRILFVN